MNGYQELYENLRTHFETIARKICDITFFYEGDENNDNNLVVQILSEEAYELFSIIETAQSKTDIQLKQRILELAKSGAPRPKPNTELGKALDRFTIKTTASVYS